MKTFDVVDENSMAVDDSNVKSMKSFSVDVKPCELCLVVTLRYDNFIMSEEICSANLVNTRSKVYVVFDCIYRMIADIEKKVEKGIVPDGGIYESSN